MLRFVLDTNIVLDWLVFHDRCVDGLQAAVNDQRVGVIVHGPSMDELCRVLTYPQFKLASDEQAEVMKRYQSLVDFAPLPDGFSLEDLLLPAGFPRCKDGDDQHFLALAYHTRADGLVTKDRQVLKLKRRAARFGVNILDPERLRALLQVAA